MLRVANSPHFERWKEQVRRTGGCAQPIHLSGHPQTVDTRTGEFFEYSTSSEPGGRLRIACGNRRASRCPSCAWTYAGDTYHLIMAGLVGGKGIPDTVAERPRVFATLTAPSFGPVHNRPDSGSLLAPVARSSRATCTAPSPALPTPPASASSGCTMPGTAARRSSLRPGSRPAS